MSNKDFESAEVVRDQDGRQYHIGVAPGELAKNIILVGDPARAERCAKRFENTKSYANRVFVTITGTHEGMPISVMATGIGCDNTEIAVVELSMLVEEANIIRAGTCGALDPSIELGDLIVTWGAVRLEGTSTYFVPEGYPAVSHPDVMRALLDAATELGHAHHFGMTATAPGFYGAQARTTPHFKPRYPDLVDQLSEIGVKNLEMECSTLLTLASLRGYRAGAVCVAFAKRHANEFVPADRKLEFEDRAVSTALAALHKLHNKS